MGALRPSCSRCASMSCPVTAMVSIRSSERAASPGASFTTMKLTSVSNRRKTAASASFFNHVMGQEMSRSLVIIWNSNSFPGVVQPVTVFLLAADSKGTVM